MSEGLSDLSGYLFAQLQRLDEENISEEKLEREVKRAEAISSIADNIVKATLIKIRAAEIAHDYGNDPTPYLNAIEKKT